MECFYIFVTDGDLTIDNNLAENALRPIALGRKNWMFLGHESGGETIEQSKCCGGIILRNLIVDIFQVKFG